ncbi:MAG TPA: DUF1080 domain-containing protein [Paludibaculum sp.]
MLLSAMLLLASAAGDVTTLLPPPDFKGWTRLPIPATLGVNPKLQWKVDAEQKALICTGDGGHEWLRYDTEVGDFELELDWKFTAKPGETKYNSGVGIRLSKQGEIWYQAQTGLAGAYLFGNNITPEGALRSFNLKADMKENRVKPAGEWNHFIIICKDDTISLSVNGVVVNTLARVGLRRGYIGFEAEGYEVTFKDIKLKSLE